MELRKNNVKTVKSFDQICLKKHSRSKVFGFDRHIQAPSGLDEAHQDYQYSQLQLLKSLCSDQELQIPFQLAAYRIPTFDAHINHQHVPEMRDELQLVQDHRRK